MSVGRHMAYNLAGSLIPMALGIVTIPIYLHLIGAARYGVLSIVWTFLGYFNAFDPGLNRAATYHIARLRDRPARERGDVFWTTLVINAGFGLLGGALVYAIARPLFTNGFKMPVAVRTEVLACLPWLAAAVPVSIITNLLGGTLYAREWFGVAGAIQIMNGLLSQAVTISVAWWHGADLAWLIPAVLLTRMAGSIPVGIAVALAVPLRAGGRFRAALLRALFSYGGWITISNLLVPILVTADRMIIGSLLSAEAVAFYTVPFNLANRLQLIPGALAASLFPKLSSRNQTDAKILAAEALLGLAAVMTPIVAMAILALPIFMRLWLGQAFANRSTTVGSILLLGIWTRGLGTIPSGQLQAGNRPDLTAKFHAAELLPFLAALWLGVHYFGLAGAAWAWTLRTTADAALLLCMAGTWAGWTRLVPGGAIILTAPFCAPATLLSLKTLLALGLTALALLWSWHVAPRLRGTLGATLRARFGRRALKPI